MPIEGLTLAAERPGWLPFGGSFAMPFTVHFFCSYLTAGQDWRPEDHSASQFTKAIKGLPFKGYAQVPTPGGGVERVRQEDTNKAVGLFAAWAAQVVQANVGGDNIILVPIPSSGATVETPTAGTGATMATAVAQRIGARAQVADVLRFSVAMQSSRHGGTRDTGTLFDRLRVIDNVPAGHVVLIDDVCTTHGHMRAAATRLNRQAGVNVDLAVCAGRTHQDPPNNPFSIPPETVPDFTPMAEIFG